MSRSAHNTRVAVVVLAALAGLGAIFAAVAVSSAVGVADTAQARALVYQTVIYRGESGSGRPLRTEWISPSTREWRFEDGGRTKIYSGGSYAVIDPNDGTYVRTGSPRFIGYLSSGAVAAEPVDALITGKRQLVSSRTRVQSYSTTRTGQTEIRFRRDGVQLRAVILSTMPLSRARSQRLFTISTASANARATERTPGALPSSGIDAYWFGASFDGRTAVTSIEHVRNVPREVASRGANSDRLEARVYVTLYELPSAAGLSSAIPGVLPPAGEVQVVSQPMSIGLSRAAVRALNGINGDERYAPWPRQEVTLANGEAATVIPNLGEGVTATSAGQRVRQFAVLTGSTLVWVSGDFALSEIGTVARNLRPVSG